MKASTQREQLYQTLVRDLGLTELDIALFDQAFTHRSVSASKNNERLEFLGDAILGQVIAKALYERFRQAKEGQLSRMRASLVNGKNLGKLAESLSFSNYLILGVGELKSGGHRRASILADAFEAVLGAIYLSQGFVVAEKVILALFAEQLQALSPEGLEKDAKTQLQELLQSQNMQLPVYTLVGTKGDDHEQEFEVECMIIEPQKQAFIARNSSRKKAEQDAARLILQHLISLAKA